MLRLVRSRGFYGSLNILIFLLGILILRDPELPENKKFGSLFMSMSSIGLIANFTLLEE